MSSLPLDEQDYRSALRKWVADRPNRGRGELKTMAEKIGVPSPVFSQILSGSRELSEDHAYILANYMELTDLEKEYFLCLVQIGRASHSEYKDHLNKKLTQIRERALKLFKPIELENALSEKDQSEFYSTWLYSAIRLFCGINRGATFDEICNEFRIPKDRGIRLLQFLIRTGLVEIKNNVYQLGPMRLHLSKDSANLSKHHSNWRIRAMERSSNLKDEELMFTAPMMIGQKDFQQLRERMINLVQEVSEVVKDSPSEKLVCLNLDFFEVKP